MNPETASIILGLLKFGLEEWARRSNKPPEWIPTESDWLLLKSQAMKPLEDYEAEARVKLGLPPEVPPGNLQ